MANFERGLSQIEQGFNPTRASLSLKAYKKAVYAFGLDKKGIDPEGRFSLQDIIDAGIDPDVFMSVQSAFLRLEIMDPHNTGAEKAFNEYSSFLPSNPSEREEARKAMRSFIDEITSVSE